MNNSNVSLFPNNIENSTSTSNEYETEIPDIVTSQSINENDSTQEAVTIINTTFDHLGFDVTDHINKLDNDYILTTLPTVDDNYISTTLPIITDYNDTDYNSKNENINYMLNNSSETFIITNFTEPPLSEGNFSLTTSINNISSNNEYILTTLPTTDNDFISTTLPIITNDNVTEIIYRNEDFNNIINNSSEISLIINTTETPQSVENVSFNGSINNILNDTVNIDTFSIIGDPFHSTTTKDLLINITEEFIHSDNKSLVLTIDKSSKNNITSEIVQNISHIGKSSYENTVSVTQWIDDEAAVEDLLYVSYNVVFPMLICLALIFNGLALYVYRRPKLASLSETRYLQFISGVNILCALNAIPATILKNHCPYSSYSAAYYYTYFSWTSVFLLRNLSICSLVWMSYDRFLYIWSLSLLNKVTQASVVKKRLISTTIVIILSFIPLICLGKVKNCTDMTHTHENVEEIWLSLSGYRRDLEDTWFAVLIVFLVQGTIHIILILLTISLFTGLKQKVFKRRKRQVDQTVALIINNISYLILDIAYVITAVFFYKYKYDQGHCYNTFARERWMATINCLLMFWASFSTLVFLFQSKVYRNQVIYALFPYCTSDRDEKIRKSVRHSIQLQQIKNSEIRQSIQLQQIKVPEVRQSIHLQQMKVPEVTDL